MKVVLCTTVILVCVVLAMAQKSSELNGHVRYNNKSPAEGVVLTSGNYSVATDRDGNYRITFLKPGLCRVLIKPPGKATRSFKVMIGSTPSQKDFVVNW